MELTTGDGVYCADRQAFTAVFSRPVIALGSDFNASISLKKVPFRLSCNLPGKQRWVTTTVFRFDPDVDWPSDLDCSLIWNANLTAYDGTQLQLGAIPVERPLFTYGLAMGVEAVLSARATNMSGGAWDYRKGVLDDKLPEVPPDGKVVLYFTDPVNLLMVQDALQLKKGEVMYDESIAVLTGPKLPYTLRPCYSDSPWVYLPLQARGSLDVNTTCAELQPDVALEPDNWYTLSMPAGSRYYALAGRLRRDASVQLAGLRRFRIPFREDRAFQSPGGEQPLRPLISYRRLNLWMTHGLATNTTAAALARTLSICKVDGPAKSAHDVTNANCKPVPFTLTLSSSILARLVVPQLAPDSVYRFSAAADAGIKDGFGQTLQASSSYLRTRAADYSFSAPATGGGYGGASLVVLEAGVDTLSSWPYITRGPPARDPNDYYAPTEYTRNLTAYTVNATKVSELIKLLAILGGASSPDATSKLKPTSTTSISLSRALTTPGSGAGWTEVLLPLGTNAGVQVTRGCCSAKWYDSTQHEATYQTVLRTSISASVVQSADKFVAWVTDASLGGGAVKGARVAFYGMTWTAPELLGDCTTNSSGICVVQLNYRSQHYSAAIFTVVTAPPAPGAAGAAAGNRLALIPSSGYYQLPSAQPPYIGSMVFDRKLVEPGDTLRVTGFVQKMSTTGLSLPPPGNAILEVSPHWQANGGWESSPRAAPRFIVQLNGTTGTIHGEIQVPTDARLKWYTVTLMVPEPGAKLPDPANPEEVSWGGDLRGWHAAATESFVVAKPRLPTAELLVEVPPWVLPNATVVVNATAVSYIGASVDASAMDVKWTHSRASGVVRVVTDANGFATAAIDLTDMQADERPTAPDTLSVTVEWVGPTRELITHDTTISIATGPAQVSLQFSVDTNLPGVPFTVAAAITSNLDGSSIAGVPVILSLRPDRADKGGAACNTTRTCNTTSGLGFGAVGSPCRLALPCVGAFLLEACATLTPAQYGSGGGDVRVCAVSPLGRSLAEWAAHPLAAHVEPGLALDRPDYAPGDTPRLLVDNPYSRAQLLVVWGNDDSVRTKLVNPLPTGVSAVTFGPLGYECLTGCVVTAVFEIPRVPADALPQLPPAAQLPVSRLFDPRAPHSHSANRRVAVRARNALRVGVTVAAVAPAVGAISSVRDADGEDVVAVEPGTIAEIAISVPLAPAGEVVEVTVYAVDKAVLDLVPYALPRPEREIQLQLASELSGHTMEAFRVAPGAVRAVFDKTMQRLTRLDPWLPVSTRVDRHATWGESDASPVDQSDETYLARFTYSVTMIAGDYESMYGEEIRPLAPAFFDSPSPDTEAQDGGTSIRSVDKFVATALAATAVVGPNGLARVNFTAPQNMGSFVIRAFVAAGKSAMYGAGQGKVVVRRRISLTASVPRFVRVGDTFEAGVVVTVGSAPVNISLALQVQGGAQAPVQVVGAAVKSYTFVAGGGLQEEIRFSFSAAAMGTANMTFRVSDGLMGGARDSLQLTFPVEGQQGDVWAATSFALAGTSGAIAPWQEGLELPGAVPGSGGLTLTAGVGYYPGIAAVYDNLLRDARRDRDIYAERVMLWVTLPAVLTSYGQVATAEQDEEVTRGFAALTTLTTEQYGLQWADTTRWGWQPNWCDIGLNTWALFLISIRNNDAQGGPRRQDWISLQEGLVHSWRDAVVLQVVKYAQEARENSYVYSDWETLAWIELTMGPGWLSPGVGDDLANDLSLARMLAAYRSNNTRGEFSRQARIALSLAVLPTGAAPDVVKATVAEIINSLRVQGRTAHVAISPGSSYASAQHEQALCLLLLVRCKSTHQLLPKLAAYVANPTATSGRFIYYSSSWYSQGLTVAALSEYDRSRGSARPRLDVVAAVSGLTVLQASFRTTKMRPVTNTTAWEVLPATQPGYPGALHFKVNGTGEVTVSASLHFVPPSLPAFPAYRGLLVESSLQLVDPRTGEPTGPRVSAVPLGSIVALTVQLSSPDELGSVTLTLMMPGGLEPLDPNIFPGAIISCGSDWVDSASWIAFHSRRWWGWPVCPAHQTRPEAVTFSYAGLVAGSSSVTVKALAASVGTFLLPPVRASVDKQPELMGMTAAESITVCAGCSGPTYAAPPAQPRACPGDCGGRGVCDLAAGACYCDPGFQGPDCSSA